jgi:ABC-type bacteriocin/lantibiotic exporter with double-glycine peptidase domain
MNAHAYSREPDALRAMTFPMIVHWNFDHFVVVEGWYPGGWYLNDPASGRRRCENAEFDTSFTGIVIELTPGDGFTRRGRRTGVIRRLLAAIDDARAVIVYSALITLLLLVPTLIVPQILRLYGDSLSGLPGLAAGVAVIGLSMAAGVQAALVWLQGSLSVRLDSKVSGLLTVSMVHRLLRLPAEFHAQRGASSLAQRAILSDSLSAGVSAVTVTATAGVLTSIAGAVALLIVDLQAGLLALGVGLVMAGALRWALLRTQDQAARVVRETVTVGAVMTSALNQVETIKASGNEDGLIARGIAAENTLLDAQQSIAVRTMFLNLLPSLIAGVGTVLVAAVAAAQVLGGRLEPGDFLAVIALAAIVVAPLASVVVALDQAQTLRATLDHVDDVLDCPEDPSFARPSVTIAGEPVRGDLRLEAVSFGYSHRSPAVVSGIDLHLPPGGRVALVGPSGSGKSTVSRLVTGLYSPWSGRVLVDGNPREAVSREILTDGVALVDQDVAIFAGTVRDNVTLWDPSIPDDHVVAALADAQLDGDVASRPGGLDALIAERGANLSGGQQQRLAIARALVRNPSLIVMDEATSALDTLTEARIDEAIRARGISVLVIAHRLSTIRDCDEIVVLVQGRIVERGRHDDLLAQGGEYATLVGSA